MDKIEKQVIELVGEQAGIDPKKISLLCKLENLNLDSVAIVELIFSLEDKFNISIPFEGIEEIELKKNFHTVSSLINYLRELLKRNV
ncbi:phosphopantetheine-binding protein [Paracoccaceae bacterium]|nr:phosphopantetheine-binding protein [Paracoccaceae bacterium]